MAQTVDHQQALAVLEHAAAVAASDQPVPVVWESRTSALAEMRSNKGAIAVLGTALLAKATNPAIDALSLHEKSGPNGYAARHLASHILAAHADSLGYALGTSAPDPLAGSPWFNAMRVDLITKWRKPARAHADQLISWLSSLTADEAPDALVAFLRVRMAVAAHLREQRAAAFAGEAPVSFTELADTLTPFVQINPEEGRRGTAAVAAAYAAAGFAAHARVVNDPGQTDIDVHGPDGFLIGIEVKQKPATDKDAIDIAAGARSAGAARALLCALDPAQPRLDVARLRRRADAEYGVALDIIFSVEEVLMRAMFSSRVSPARFLSQYAEALAVYLSVLQASPEAQARWRAAADRWAA